MDKNAGFTLIELMIVVLIVGLMLLVAAPFTSAWTDSATLTRGEGVVIQAIGRAKAAAQRNEGGVSSDRAAAAVCVSATNTISVLVANVATGADCTPTGDLLWSVNLPTNFDVGRTDAILLSAGTNGLCFNNRGLKVSPAAMACDLDDNLTLAVGAESATINFY